MLVSLVDGKSSEGQGSDALGGRGYCNGAEGEGRDGMTGSGSGSLCINCEQYFFNLKT